MAASEPEIVYISGCRPLRDEIPAANPMFSGVAYSMVHTATTYHAPLYQKFKMAVVKPEVLESLYDNRIEMNFKRY